MSLADALNPNRSSAIAHASKRDNALDERFLWMGVFMLLCVTFRWNPFMGEPNTTFFKFILPGSSRLAG
jgi:hypothetical protein